MPVFFQHTDDKLQLVLWRQQEPETFFCDQLPVANLAVLPSHPAKRLEFLVGRFLLRFLSSDFPFDRLEVLKTGRPYLTDDSIQFSISHSGTMVAALIHPEQPVGVDVEKISERVSRVRRKFLSQAEELLVLQSMGEEDELTCLTLAWSVKEAAFKALQNSGVDFIRDLPIVRLHAQGDTWIAQLGGMGTDLALCSMVFDSICLSWAIREMKDEG